MTLRSVFMIKVQLLFTWPKSFLPIQIKNLIDFLSVLHLKIQLAIVINLNDQAILILTLPLLSIELIAHIAFDLGVLLLDPCYPKI